MRLRSEALPFLLPLGLAVAVAAAVGAVTVALVTTLATLAVAGFFRDPDRRPRGPVDAVLSPADGRVVAASDDPGGSSVAVFLALWNVHVARAPVSGRVESATFVPGGYRAAFRSEAADNARYVMRIRTRFGDVELALIAGMIARRVVPWIDVGDRLERGQRIALIRFGSRAEVRLPRGFRTAVATDDGARAGETVIARRRPTETST